MREQITLKCPSNLILFIWLRIIYKKKWNLSTFIGFIMYLYLPSQELICSQTTVLAFLSAWKLLGLQFCLHHFSECPFSLIEGLYKINYFATHLSSIFIIYSITKPWKCNLSTAFEKITQCVLNALFDFVQKGLNDKHHHTPLFVEFFLI